MYMASKLGYTKKQFGGKIGYDQSLITAITRHFNEAVKYDEGLGMEVPQKSRKQPIMGDYYTYNGERDNVDYDWEKNENKNMILYVNNGGKKVHINESSLILLREDLENEVARYSPNGDGTIDFYIPPIHHKKIITDKSYNPTTNQTTFVFNTGEREVYNGDLTHYNDNYFNDKYNTDEWNRIADTRLFGDKESILHGDGKGKRGDFEKAVLAKQSNLNCYNSAINALNNGVNDESAISISQNASKTTVNAVLAYFRNRDMDKLIAGRNRVKKELDMISNRYGRAFYSIDNSQNSASKIRGNYNDNAFNQYFTLSDGRMVPAIPKYEVGLVPGTDVKVIALFRFKNFNFSDAIKNGELRQDNMVRNYLGVDKSTVERLAKLGGKGNGVYKKINATYDGGITPDVMKNFSLNGMDISHYNADKTAKMGNNVDHFKYQYNTQFDNNGNATSDYNSVSQFMDKSIMAAAYALRKERIKVDFILAAPSSSKYNHYYCINLSRKLGAEYNPEFFTRNMLEIKFDKEQALADGIEPKLITGAENCIKQVALSEISANLLSYVKKFVNDNIEYLSNIPVKKSSRTKITTDLLVKLLQKFAYYGLANIGAFNSSSTLSGMKKLDKAHMVNNRSFVQPKTTNVYKYLVNHFSEYVNTKDYNYKEDVDFILPYVMNIIRTRLSVKFQDLLAKMTKEVNAYESMLLSDTGYRLNYNRKFKITDVDAAVRPYIKDAYIVANKELAYDKNYDNDNKILRNKYLGKSFLIIDEDMNSGGTLKLLIQALKDVMIDMKKPKDMSEADFNNYHDNVISSNQICCLVNLYTLQSSNNVQNPDDDENEEDDY